MSKPQGTYLRSQAAARGAADATDAKKTVAVSKAKEQAKFYDTLDKIAESRLSDWHRSMNALASAIKKSEPLSKEDKVRKAVSEVLGEVKKLLAQAKDFKSLESTLHQPATAVLRAPQNLGLAGAELTLVIALTQVLAILVRIRGDKNRH